MKELHPVIGLSDSRHESFITRYWSWHRIVIKVSMIRALAIHFRFYQEKKKTAIISSKFARSLCLKLRCNLVLQNWYCRERIQGMES